MSLKTLMCSKQMSSALRHDRGVCLIHTIVPCFTNVLKAWTPSPSALPHCSTIRKNKLVIILKKCNVTYHVRLSSRTCLSAQVKTNVHQIMRALDLLIWQVAVISTNAYQANWYLKHVHIRIHLMFKLAHVYRTKEWNVTVVDNVWVNVRVASIDTNDLAMCDVSHWRSLFVELRRGKKFVHFVPSCAGHSDGFYLDRTKPNCQSYIQCMDNRVANHSRCPLGQRFNRNIGRCAPADQVPCRGEYTNGFGSNELRIDSCQKCSRPYLVERPWVVMPSRELEKMMSRIEHALTFSMFNRGYCFEASFATFLK
jgi:hypothetical protein